MRVTVRFFASHREATGCSLWMADLGEGARAADVLSSALKHFPTLGGMAAGVSFAVNRQQVPPDTVVYDGDELALLPPMAGG